MITAREFTLDYNFHSILCPCTNVRSSPAISSPIDFSLLCRLLGGEQTHDGCMIVTHDSHMTQLTLSLQPPPLVERLGIPDIQ